VTSDGLAWGVAVSVQYEKITKINLMICQFCQIQFSYIDDAGEAKCMVFDSHDNV